MNTIISIWDNGKRCSLNSGRARFNIIALMGRLARCITTTTQKKGVKWDQFRVSSGVVPEA